MTTHIPIENTYAKSVGAWTVAVKRLKMIRNTLFQRVNKMQVGILPKDTLNRSLVVKLYFTPRGVSTDPYIHVPTRTCTPVDP